MNTQTLAPAAPNNALSAGILQAIDWVDAARHHPPAWSGKPIG